MVTLLKKTFSITAGLSRSFIWLLQYFMIWPNRKAVSLKSLEGLKLKKVMILIPHADDELVGCYQIARQPGVEVFGYYFGFINESLKTENRDLRRLELEKSAHELGIKLIVSAVDPVEQIKDLLLKNTWDLIAVPSFVDWHPDHIEVNDVLLRAMDQINEGHRPDILTYQVSVPLAESVITHYAVLTDKEQRMKWDMFKKIYKTQEYIPIFRFMLNEKISGRLVSAFAAEVYSLYSYSDYRQALFASTKINREELRASINNLVLIRQAVKKCIV